MLKLLAIVFLSMGIAVLGYLYYKELQKNDIISDATIYVREPRMVSEVVVIHSDGDGVAIAIKEGSFPQGVAAAAMIQWTSRALIGVDFTGFNWKTIDGIGEPIPEDGHVTLSGTIPPLEVLHNFYKIGSEKKRLLADFLISQRRPSFIHQLKQREMKSSNVWARRLFSVPNHSKMLSRIF